MCFTNDKLNAWRILPYLCIMCSSVSALFHIYIAVTWLGEGPWGPGLDLPLKVCIHHTVWLYCFQNLSLRKLKKKMHEDSFRSSIVNLDWFMKWKYCHERKHISRENIRWRRLYLNFKTFTEITDRIKKNSNTIYMEYLLWRQPPTQRVMQNRWQPTRGFSP